MGTGNAAAGVCARPEEMPDGPPSVLAGLGCPCRAGGEAYGEVVGYLEVVHLKIQFALGAGCRCSPQPGERGDRC